MSRAHESHHHLIRVHSRHTLHSAHHQTSSDPIRADNDTGTLRLRMGRIQQYL